MVKLMSIDRNSVTLVEKIPVAPGSQSTRSPNWYNPLFNGFTNIRTARFVRRNTEKQLRELLIKESDLHIYTVIDNKPFLSTADEDAIAKGITNREKLITNQRVRDEDGDDYIDEFGMYVYITSRVGTSPDIDLRYDGEPEPELFKLQLIEHEETHPKTIPAIQIRNL